MKKCIIVLSFILGIHEFSIGQTTHVAKNKNFASAQDSSRKAKIKKENKSYKQIDSEPRDPDDIDSLPPVKMKHATRIKQK